jgi:hypothetical protein
VGIELEGFDNRVLMLVRLVEGLVYLIELSTRYEKGKRTLRVSCVYTSVEGYIFYQHHNTLTFGHIVIYLYETLCFTFRCQA